jgi:NAD(P)-dependent dehydrogenase (short-subunit alcohol dehydrogenase family)
MKSFVRPPLNFMYVSEGNMEAKTENKNNAISPTTERVALVTGATGGIGTAICEVLNSLGYLIVVGFKNRAEAASKLAKRLRHGVALQMDVSDEKSIEVGIAKIESSIGSLDVLVNNAGVLSGLVGPLNALSHAQWSDMLTVNVMGTIWTTVLALPMLHKSEAGRVINISSVHAISGGRPGLSAYTTAKASIIGFTKAASKELAPNITVNAIAPGFVEVGMTASLSEEQKARARKMIPMKRFAYGREVGTAVAFLASVDAAYITGHVLVVRGGRIDLDIM